MISPPLTELARRQGDRQLPPPQPTVKGTPDVRGYLFNGVLVDLYLDHDEDIGYYVTDLALTGTNISLIGMFEEAEKVMDRIGNWCNENLESQESLAAAEHAGDVFDSWIAAGKPTRYGRPAY